MLLAWQQQGNPLTNNNAAEGEMTELTGEMRGGLVKICLTKMEFEQLLTHVVNPVSLSLDKNSW